jgi:hypothetical protein
MSSEAPLSSGVEWRAIFDGLAIRSKLHGTVTALGGTRKGWLMLVEQLLIGRLPPSLLNWRLKNVELNFASAL